MVLWSSLGWKKEVTADAEIKDIVENKINDYKKQKITLSWIEDGEQQDNVIYNGLDEEKRDSWLEIIRTARKLN